MSTFLLLFACRADTEQATWLEGFAFGWTHFNHRLSHLVTETQPGVGHLAFVGGTSTTNLANEPTGTCAVGCQELPFTDTSDASLRYGSIATSQARFATGTLALETGAEGASGEIAASFSGEPRGELFAVLTGLRYDSAVPLPGEPSCYDPANGWLPRRIAVELGEPVAVSADVTVPVTVWFEAGNALEDIRACIDAVRERAQARLTVSILVVATREEVHAQVVEGGSVFPWNGSSVNPDPQVPTDDVPLDAAFGPATLAGWTAGDWRFFEGDPDNRGAYLRTLDLGLDLDAGFAHGQATNYSPITQISGFEYSFDGAIAGATLSGELVHGVAAIEGLPAALDAEGRPELTEVSLALAGLE